jgi:hypothetical protein
MIELTLEQRKAVAQDLETPPRVLDSETNTGYVLIRAEVYERIRQLLDLDDNQFTRDLAPHVMEFFGQAGWDDPAMDIYNELDPRFNS